MARKAFDLRGAIIAELADHLAIVPRTRVSVNSLSADGVLDYARRRRAQTPRLRPGRAQDQSMVLGASMPSKLSSAAESKASTCWPGLCGLPRGGARDERPRQSRILTATCSSVIMLIIDILPEHFGQTSTSRRYARFMSVAQCASSKGWRVQREEVPPG